MAKKTTGGNPSGYAKEKKGGSYNYQPKKPAYDKVSGPKSQKKSR